MNSSQSKIIGSGEETAILLLIVQLLDVTGTYRPR